MKQFKKLFTKLIFLQNKKSFLFFLVFIFLFLNLIFFIVSLLNGYEKYIMDNLVVNSFHIDMEKKDGSYIGEKTVKEITGKLLLKKNLVMMVTPYTLSQALFKYKDFYTGVQIFAFDFDHSFKDNIKKIQGDYDKNGIIIGNGLKKDFNIDIKENVQLINLEEKMNVPVTGFFKSGVFDLDNFFVFMDVKLFSDFNLMPYSFKSMGIYLRNIKEIDKVKKILEKEFPEYDFTDVYEKNSLFLSAMQSEKMLSTIIALLISFLFFVCTWLFTVSRINFFRKEFAYLIAGGIKRQYLIRQTYSIMFSLFTVIFLASSFVSWYMCKIFNGKIYIPSQVYYVDKLYIEFDLKYFYVLTGFYFLFLGIKYFFIKYFFNNICLEEELRSN